MAKFFPILIATLAFIGLTTVLANVIPNKENEVGHSEKRECLSCSSVDEEESRVLFAINRFIESTGKDGKYTSSEEALNDAIEKIEQNDFGFYAEFSEFEPKEILTDILSQLKTIKNFQGCQEEESDVLRAFEARLIEGEEPTNPNVPYLRRELSILLEKYHIEMVKECVEAIKLTTHSVETTPEYKQFTDDFFKFSESVVERLLPENKLYYGKVNHEGIEGIWTASSMFSVEDKKILSTLIKDFFGGEEIKGIKEELEVASKVWINLNKYESFRRDIESSIEPLFYLADYKPQRYAPSKIADSEKENREIFKVAKLIKGLLDTDQEALKLVGSYALLDKTFTHFDYFGITGEGLPNGLYRDGVESDSDDYESESEDEAEEVEASAFKMS